MFMSREAHEKNPGSDVVKKASLKWKTLTAAERQPYIQMKKDDDARLDREMKEYRENYPAEYELFL
jgi:hypothetical protein